MNDLILCKEAIEFLVDKDIFCAQMTENWTKIVEIVGILKIPFIATKILQRSDLTMSDLFGCWLNMERKLDNIIENENCSTNLAEILRQKVFERKQILLENPMMLAAIYLDARFNFTLTETQVEEAKSTLISLYRKIKQILPGQSVEPQSAEDSFEEYCAVTSNKRARADDDKLNSGSKVNALMSVNEFIIFIDAFDNTVNRLHSKVSIIKHWEERKNDDPELLQLARILNTIPPTQVAVERAFSTLNFVFSNRRAQLSPALLENILLIYLNKDMVAKIHQDDLEELRNNCN